MRSSLTAVENSFKNSDFTFQLRAQLIFYRGNQIDFARFWLKYTLSPGLGSTSKCIYFLESLKTFGLRYKFVSHFSEVGYEILHC
jgi:hypothetical protein